MRVWAMAATDGCVRDGQKGLRFAERLRKNRLNGGQKIAQEIPQLVIMFI